MSIASAAADQTDPGLEALFKELRDGTVIDANETTARIVEIWSQAPGASTNVLFDRAHQAIAEDNLPLAKALLSHVVGLSPSFAQGWALQAEVHLATGERDKATSAYLKVLELEPRHFIASAELADILVASDQKETAFEMYQRALQWNPHLSYAKEQAARLRRELAGQEI